MSTIAHDPGLIDAVAANFDLREPNRRALDGLVSHIAVHQDPNETVEVVTNLATGVGKTYLMAALIDYMAHQGVRNFLVATPGKTILSKTLENFDAASQKYIAGAEHRPFVFTRDNFRTANASRAFDDPKQVKVGVFTIQSLLGSTKEDRKVRRQDENLGTALYDLLAEAEDLVVVADEHYVYRHQAKKFSQALRELTPRSLVGLTATPDKADYDKVVVEYTLGEAIADGYVKTPVIVYRRDGIKDESIQLADAVALLNRKADSYQRYVDRTEGAKQIRPAMFVVCESIEHASHVASVLRGPGMLDGEDQVLLATSESPEEDLKVLDEVDEPGSPVRAIVSVNKLKEGWDVKRIAVIVALRKLASESLTEQILGRGLRLPFKTRTGSADVDQVDLVAHDSYEQLLAQKDLLAQRVGSGHETPPPDTDETGGAPIPDGVLPEETPEPPAAPVGTPDNQFGGGERGQEIPPGEGRYGGLVIRRRDEDEGLDGPRTMTYAGAPGAPDIVFPRLYVFTQTGTFDLTDITEAEAREAGRKYREEVPTFSPGMRWRLLAEERT